MGRLRILLVAIAVAGCGVGGTVSQGSSAGASADQRQASRSQTHIGRRSPSRTAEGVRLVRVGVFQTPVGVTAPVGDPSQVFVVQKGGQVMVMNRRHVQRRPFLDVSKLVSVSGEEQGLLGLTFSPNYASNGLFYVDYTIANDDIRIVQYARSADNPDLADPASARIVLTIPHPYANHNGGQLAFGPDGDLYIAVGDGGSEGDPHSYGQNTDVLLGKILRIDPSPNGGYTVPATNPFVGKAHRRAEIWAYGLRNPWRFSFDRLTGALIIGDVGQDLEEEIDYAPAGTGAGANYGWSIWEGDRRNKPGAAPHAVFPVLVAHHSAGYCAIIGGYVVRDKSLPSLYGRYLFGDYCRQPIESVKLTPGHASGLSETGLSVSGTSSFGQDAVGHIYITSLGGPVYRIAPG